ncbi:putative glycosyl transferase [Pseudovibrio axinellae]|uniref:Putative glycosyl transferase n=1 Tax=Pseudovibrio axinellae TaxID=989403 RepID=A0A165W2C1_9HYPH|nr:glycosyltransferase family 2 protein [Pseudovibrio axinellae]KZL15860.1 putative glycosyl transferase [Pseudovibrio axinellae]SER83051.1 succinoglycan biosynthesis protein ExoM [Pseudovibrio axinellae]
MNKPIKIGVMICTRKRPEMLKSCIQSVLPQINSSQYQDFVVVIENDEQDHCRDIVSSFQRGDRPNNIHYLIERNLGIPLARQRGVDFALEQGADWMAFVDDDEEMADGWLEAMREAAGEFDCAAITGPVRYIYSSTTPDWLDCSQPKEKARGTRLLTAATNNTLLNATWYKRHDCNPRFDQNLRFTGGSDTDFFYRLTDMGGTIKWVDDAWVNETVPEERLTMPWQLQRSQRTAANATQIAKKRKGSFYAVKRYLPKSVGRFVRGILGLILAACVYLISPRSAKRITFKALKNLFSGTGSWRGFLGKSPQPYLRITGK